MIGFIVAGLIIGLLARLLLPGRQKIGLLWTLALGVAGSVVGGVIANLIGSGDIMELNVFGFIVAVIAAVALLAIAERTVLQAGTDRDRLERQCPRGGERGRGQSSLGIVVFGLLAALLVVVAAFPPRGTAGIVMFAVGVVLVGVVFVRFNPAGDLWEAADELGVRPWFLVVAVVLLAAAWGILRLGLLEAGGATR